MKTETKKTIMKTELVFKQKDESINKVTIFRNKNTCYILFEPFEIKYLIENLDELILEYGLQKALRKIFDDSLKKLSTMFNVTSSDYGFKVQFIDEYYYCLETNAMRYLKEEKEKKRTKNNITQIKI